MNLEKLAVVDPEIDGIIHEELNRQRNKIELIASENFVTPAVMEAMGTILTNKYAEGYPGHRYYGGCEYVDKVETLAIERAKKLFGAKFANVQPHCGASTNMTIYFAFLKPGDTMTLEQALHLLLISSANDVALMIAENIGGTVEHFLEMMNDEAKRLGATNTNFANPHGLTDPDHYTTAYDLYLIFNEAIKYDKFNEIIHMSEYQTIYYDKNGNEKKKTIKTTNRYLRGTVETPENVTIIGGKSGTTMAAGSCLIILSKDAKGSSYISVILHSKNIDELYKEMTTLLEEINK